MPRRLVGSLLNRPATRSLASRLNELGKYGCCLAVAVQYGRPQGQALGATRAPKGGRAASHQYAGTVVGRQESLTRSLDAERLGEGESALALCGHEAEGRGRGRGAGGGRAGTHLQMFWYVAEAEPDSAWNGVLPVIIS